MNISAKEYAQKAQELCVLPDVYLQLKKAIEDDDAQLKKIADLISLEPALASSLLKIANSAVYNFTKEVDSITKAISILGMHQVSNLVSAYAITAALSEVDSRVMDMDRFWEISVDCALICKFLATNKELANIDSLFLSGLFHNLGALAIVHQEPEKVAYCEAYDKEATPWYRQKQIFGFTYSQCSVELLSSWNIPESIVTPIKEVHNNIVDKQAMGNTLLYVAARLAVVNSHPGLYKIKQLIKPTILEELSLSDQILQDALEFCNAEGMNIMSAIGVTQSKS